MKKFLIILITLLSLEIPCYAEDPKGDQLIGLEFDQLKSTPKRHRAPLHINVEARYETTYNSIIVMGSEQAEVNLYLNGNLIDHNDEVNATFVLPETTGIYTVEIIGSNWTAVGYLSL